MKLSRRFLLCQQRRALATATTFVRRVTLLHTHLPSNTPPPQYQIRDPTLGMRSINSFSFIHARQFSIQHQPQQQHTDTQEEEDGLIHGEREVREVRETPSPPSPPPTPASNIPAGSKTRVLELMSPFSNRQELVKVVVIKNVKCASYWCNQLVQDLDADGDNVIGVDVEWKPSFRAGQKAAKAAVLQLSGAGICLIIQLQQVVTMPRSLKLLMANPKYVKVGVAVDDDLAKLRRDWGLYSQSYHDVGRAGGRIIYNEPLRTVALKKLIETLWDVNGAFIKPQRVQTGNWEKEELTINQIEYAALDAMAGRAIFLEFKKRGLMDLKVLEAQMRGYLAASPQDGGGGRRLARSIALECDGLKRVFMMVAGECCLRVGGGIK